MATAARDPLEQLGSRIAEARRLPEPEPYVTAADPMEALRARLRGEDAAPANTNTAPAPASTTEPTGGDLASLIGQEVLQMVATRPLPAEAREEAVRRVSVALQNPSPDNIRSVLAVLITGRTDA
jgi:hypothetical protein